MEEDVYRKLARVLEPLPNGFPSSEDGGEIKDQDRIVPPPINGETRFEERGRARGVDFSKYK